MQGLDKDIDFHSAPTCALEYLISFRFSVSPIRSFKAYEEVTMPDGEIVRLTHYVFGYACYCEKHDKATVAKLAKKLWEDIKLAWPPGTFLMWRKYPELSEDVDSRGKLTTKITLRIGSFIPPTEVGSNFELCAKISDCQ